MGHDIPTGTQPHLDAMFGGIPSGDVLEVVHVQPLGVQPGAQHLDDVAIEVCGHPGPVVVGGDEPTGVLDEVGAQEKIVAGLQGTRDPTEEARPLGLVEIADGPAEEYGHSRPGVVGQSQVGVVEVAVQWLHRDGGELGGDLLCRRREHLDADIEGYVGETVVGGRGVMSTGE